MSAPTRKPVSLTRFGLLFCGIYATLGGLLSLAAWIFNLPSLADWFSVGISTQPNTALATFFAGTAILCLARPARIPAAICGAVVALIGGATLLQILGGFDFGIDTLLMFDRPWGREATVHPGRMGPPAATSWTLLGCGIVLASLSGWSRARELASGFALVTCAIASLPLIGYLYQAHDLYSRPSITAIALQTTTFILACSIGMFLAIPDNALLRLFSEESPAGRLLRRSLPVVIGAPVVLGLLYLGVRHAGWVTTEFGTAARTVVEILLFFALLSWTGHAASQEIKRKRLLERQLQHVTDNAAVMVTQCSRDLRYVYANKMYCEGIGRRIDEVIGSYIPEILGEEAFATIRPYVERVLAGERVDYESELKCPGTGPPRYLRISYVPDFSEDGQVNGWIAAITDISDRKRIEDALRTADRRKDEFLATLAHELRNPLAPIRSAVMLMGARAALNTEEEAAVAIVERQVAQMARLLDDLLDVSRISRDKLELRRERIELGLVIRDAIEASRPCIDELGHHVSIGVSTNPIYLYADPVRLGQIFGNLVNNACKYTPPGGQIAVTVEQHNDDAVVRVRDNGIGIPADKLGGIFDIFSQVDRSLEKTQGGLGIGLHLVKRMVDLHGGSVEVQSKGVGQGTEFVVRLPVATAVTTVEAPAAQASPIPAAAVGRRILVVDDNDDAATALSMLLEHLGHETAVAHDGLEALDKVQDYAPDVVLLDIGLPRMNGYETCRRIRASTGPHQPLIVALTGWGSERDREQSREAGFDGHLVKPVEHEKLMALLRSSTELRRH